MNSRARLHSDAAAGAHGAHGGEGPGVGHVVPAKLLVGVLLALLVLTVVTVAVSYIHLGPFNLAVALVIAMIKALLVATFFMHLRWDKPFNAVVFAATLFFLGIFIGFCVLDTQEYQHLRDTSYEDEAQAGLKMSQFGAPPTEPPK